MLQQIRLTAAAAALLFGACAQAQIVDETIDTSPSAIAMAADLIVVRPLSFVATVLGTGLFVAQLPLSLIQWESPAVPARKLVVEPATYTFTRPLGEME